MPMRRSIPEYLRVKHLKWRQTRGCNPFDQLIFTVCVRAEVERIQETLAINARVHKNTLKYDTTL